MARGKPGWIEYSTLLLAAAILTGTLFVPPVVGLANNGDFHKVIGGYSLAAPVADEFKFSPVTYTFDSSHYLPFMFHTTEQILALGAIGLNGLVRRGGVFDIRFIGAIHGVLYLLALWLALPLLGRLSPWRRAFCSALILFVFFDGLYVCSLNSFYMDTPAFLFALLSLIFACRVIAWRRRWDIAGFLVCALCMIGSKAQHAVLGIPLALLLAVRPPVLLPGLARWVQAGVACLVLAATILGWRATPPDYAAPALFTSEFFGVLPRTEEPDRALGELGLDASYKKYAGLYYYADGVPNQDVAFAHAFFQKTSYARLGWYLLRHPALTYRLVTAGMGDAGRERPVMGNYDRSTGVAPLTEDHRFSIWSDCKARLFEHHGARYLWFTLATGAVLLAVVWFRRAAFPAGSFELACLLVAMIGVELLGFTLGDGIDFPRHAFLFIALSDAALTALVAAIIDFSY